MLRVAHRPGLLLALCLVSVPVAAEDPPGLALTWAAPEGCPQLSAVRARVRELAGSSIERPLAADGVIERTGSRFSLRLAIRDGGNASERALESDSCEDLSGAAAVTLSLLLRGSASRAASESPPPAKASGSAAPPPPPSEKPVHADSGSERGASAEWHLGLQAPLVTLELGPLPKPSFGIAAGVGLHVDAWTFFALGQWTREQRIESDEFRGFGADVSRVAGSVWACRGWQLASITVSPCVALWLEHLRARGVGLDLVPRTERIAWASPAVGAVGHYRLLDFLAVVLSASGRLEGARPRLEVLGLGEIDRLGAASGMLAAGTEWIF